MINMEFRVGEKVIWNCWPKPLTGKIVKIEPDLLHLEFKNHKDMVVEFEEVQKIERKGT